MSITPIPFSALTTEAKTEVTGANYIEQSLLRMVQLVQTLENKPEYNPSGVNRINVSMADNGNAVISITLPTTKSIDDGSFSDIVTPYLTDPSA